jgi:hypothetical protein
VPVETLEIPRNTWYTRLSEKSRDIYLMWLNGGGKIAYFANTEDFYYWSIDGSPRDDLVPVEEAFARVLTTRLRHELFASTK